jgi:DNA-binding response OmpR family regulator
MSRVLIADSYADAADSTALVLRLHGYECAVAHSGPEALDVALSFVPDVALLELALKDIDGLTVARRLRGYGIIPIALTGYGDSPHRLQAAQAGFLAYLIKPVAIEELEAAVESLTSASAHAPALDLPDLDKLAASSADPLGVSRLQG